MNTSTLTMKDIPLTQNLVQHLFDYDQETGHLIWKTPLAKIVKKGQIAGAIDRGYYRVGIYGNRYDAQNIVWLYAYGYIPENTIDHIDRNKLNNRLDNLREVSHQCNIRNACLASNNTSGIKGVYFDKRNGTWFASIKVKGKSYRLGSGPTYIDAVCLRLAAEQCLDWTHCDANSPAYKCVQYWVKESKRIKTNLSTGY